MPTVASPEMTDIMQALMVGQEPGTIHLCSDAPIPRPDDNEVLVEILFAGQNPPDAYVLDAAHSAPYHSSANVLGSDFAGIVRESKARGIAVGEKVCGWLPGNVTPRGTYAQYAVCNADLVIRCPDHIPMEQMAALPFSFFTALHGLACGLNIDLDGHDEQRLALVWGAGTACGQYAVQLLAHARVPVIAVAARSSLEMLRSMGAQAVYAREGAAQACAAIRQELPTLDRALGCHGSLETADACVQAVSKGHVRTLLPSQPSIPHPGVQVTFGLVHSMLGHPIDFLVGMLGECPSPEELAAHHALAKTYASFDQGRLYRLLRDGTIRPLPVRRWPVESAPSRSPLTGLEGIQQAIHQSRTGSLPSGKIVHAVGSFAMLFDVSFAQCYERSCSMPSRRRSCRQADRPYFKCSSTSPGPLSYTRSRRHGSESLGRTCVK